MCLCHTGEILPEDSEGADGSQKQGKPLLALHPELLMAFPLALPSLSLTFSICTSSFYLSSRTQMGGRLESPSERALHPLNQELKMTGRWANTRMHIIASVLWCLVVFFFHGLSASVCVFYKIPVKRSPPGGSQIECGVIMGGKRGLKWQTKSSYVYSTPGCKKMRGRAVPAHYVPLPACVIVFRPPSFHACFILADSKPDICRILLLCVSAVFCRHTQQRSWHCCVWFLLFLRHL